MYGRPLWIRTRLVGHMAVVLVWHLVTASVIIMINPTLPNCTFKVHIHPPYASNSILLMKKASTSIRFGVWVCVVNTACSVDWFFFYNSDGLFGWYTVTDNCTNDYLDDRWHWLQMLDVAHACRVVCMVFSQNETMGVVTMVIFGAKWLLNWMTIETISTASLCLFDCINLSLDSVFDHGVTKSKQCYIKSLAQHEMLSYYVTACLFC